MSHLTSKARKKLPKSVFGLPNQRKYPMPDKAHAVNAKVRAVQQYNAGNISKSTEQTIIAKANKIIKRK